MKCAVNSVPVVGYIPEVLRFLFPRSLYFSLQQSNIVLYVHVIAFDPILNWCLPFVSILPYISIDMIIDAAAFFVCASRLCLQGVCDVRFIHSNFFKHHHKNTSSPSPQNSTYNFVCIRDISKYQTPSNSSYQSIPINSIRRRPSLFQTNSTPTGTWCRMPNNTNP